ncbi:hypothetical protein T484DRAFT_1761272 [Baffinella frigidus]|nr:hypothetical protein T484DRAFT_1761272 [Cryptophyta sp. CCMP2293]
MVLRHAVAPERSKAKNAWSPTTAFVLGQETAGSPSFSSPVGPRGLPVPPPSEKIAAKSAMYAATLRDKLRGAPPVPSQKHERSPAKPGRRDASPAGDPEGRSVGGVEHWLASVVVRVRPASREEQLDPDFEECVAVDEEAGTVQVTRAFLSTSTFNFERVFGPNSSTDDLYVLSPKPLQALG